MGKMEWSTTAVLRRVHAVLIRMIRSGSEAAAEAWSIVVDSSSVRAKRGGALTGPNPTDRGKLGTKYHLVVTTDGLPVAALPSAANVHDTRLFPDLLRLAMVVCASIARLYTDAGYDSADNRWLCLREGIQPIIRKIGEPHGSGLGNSAVSWSTPMLGYSRTSAWTAATTGWAPSSMRFSQPLASSWSPLASLGSENRPLLLFDYLPTGPGSA